MAGEWVPIEDEIAYRWDVAEIKRMQRTEDEANALLRWLARQRVRFIVAHLVSRRTRRAGLIELTDRLDAALKSERGIDRCAFVEIIHAQERINRARSDLRAALNGR